MEIIKMPDREYHAIKDRCAASVLKTLRKSSTHMQIHITEMSSWRFYNDQKQIAVVDQTFRGSRKAGAEGSQTFLDSTSKQLNSLIGG